MPPTLDPDYDERLKVRLKESFEACFPAWADRFELADTPLEWAAAVSRLVSREEARALLLEAGCEQ